jgi:perosamine synthetase
LERVDALVADRRRVANSYTRALSPFAEELGFHLPREASWAKSVFWLFSLRVPAMVRDSLMGDLAETGIETRPFFPPMHTLPMYLGAEHGNRNYPVAEELATTGINLPTYYGLTEDDIQRVSETLIAQLRRRV